MENINKINQYYRLAKLKGEKEMDSKGCYLVSWDFTHGKDKSIVLVGVQEKGKEVKVVNVFEGPEAEDIITKLSTKKQEGK